MCETGTDRLGDPNKEVRKLKKDKSVSHGAYVTLPKLENEEKAASSKKTAKSDGKGFQKLKSDVDPKSRKFATGHPKKEPEKPKEEPAKDPFLHVVITSDEKKESTTKDGIERRPFKVGKQKPKEGDLENFISALPKLPDRLIFDTEKEKPNVFNAKTMNLPSKKISPPDSSFKRPGQPRSVPLGALTPSKTGSFASPASTNNLTWARTSSSGQGPFGAARPSMGVPLNNPRSNRSYTLPTMFPPHLTSATSHITAPPGQNASTWGGQAPYGSGLMSSPYNMRYNPANPSGAQAGMSGQAGRGYPYGAYGASYGYPGSFAQRYQSANPYQSAFSRYPMMYGNPYMPYGYGYYSSRYQMPPGPNRVAMRQTSYEKPASEEKPLEESPIFDKPPVSIEEGMKTADKTRTKRRNGLIATMVAMLLVIAVGVGYLVYTEQIDPLSLLGIGAAPEQGEEGSSQASSSAASSSATSSSSSSSSASASAGSVVYQYTALTADGTSYTVEETVTFDAEGACEFTTMEMEFPNDAACRAYVDVLSNDYGSKLTVDSMDGAKATVTIDNSSLHLDREEYENTLRYSVQDLVILRK